MQDSSVSSTRWAVALALLMLLNGAVLFVWTHRDTQPLAWDQAIHTKIAMDYEQRLATGKLSELFKPVDMNYPPLYHLMLIPALHVVSDIADAGALVNYFHQCLLVLAVFGVGFLLLGPWQGFTAAVLVSFYPTLTDLSHSTLIDLSLTAWVAAAFFFLVLSDNFSNFSAAVAFGMALGAAMLTKWTALGYLFFPLMWAIFRAARNKKFLIAVISLFIAAAVMAPWYLQNFIPMLIRVPKLAGLPPASSERLSGLANVFWYPLSLGQQMSATFVILLVLGIPSFLWRPKMGKVLLWFVGSMLLFSLIRNKNIRYFAPALPAAALITVAWLPTFKRVAFVIVMILGLALLRLATPPANMNWQHEAIIETVQKVKPTELPAVTVLVVANTPYFHSVTLNISARAKAVKNILFRGPSKQRSFEFSDFVLFKTGDLGPAFTLGTINKCAAVIQDQKSWFAKSFKEVARWPLPDGSEAILYECRPTPEKVADPGLFNMSLDRLDLPNVSATGMQLRVTPISAADTAVGRFKELSVTCASVDYKGVLFRNVRIRLLKPQINLPLFFETGQIELHRLGSLEPRATIPADAIILLAREKVKWLSDPTIEFDGSVVRISGQAKGVPIRIVADVKVEQNRFVSKLESLRIYRIPVPLFFLTNLTDVSIPLNRDQDWSYDIVVPSVYGAGGNLSIGAVQ